MASPMDSPTPSRGPVPTIPHSPPSFDIVATYNRLLAQDPDITMPVAAIEALVEALAASSASTISETLTLLSQHTAALKAAIPNPISLSAGTDLFQRYLIATLNQPQRTGFGPGGDFRSIRGHLLSNGRLYVERAKASRERIASFGRHFIRDGATVLTNGGSRVVGALLRSAAEASGGRGSIRFRVIYVLSTVASRTAATAKDVEVGTSAEGEGLKIVQALRERGVPVATIPESAVAYSLGKVDMVIVGAEGVVENGGIISRLGTYQMGMLAKSAGKPFYVVAESHKFVRLYPLSQFDLPINQRVIDFRVIEKGKEIKAESAQGPAGMQRRAQVLDDEGVEIGLTAPVMNDGSLESRLKCSGNGVGDAVDFTPPDFISGIITESGVLTPSAVSEELIKIWF